ncbi:MAG: uroporphyrinogen-III synthase [Sulfitobacter sp.]
MTKPLLLITRPQASADRFVALLSQDARAQSSIVISPLLRIIPTGDQPDLSSYAGVIFTSANAVELCQNGNGLPAYCVGETTAKVAATSGWTVVTTAMNADGLVENIIKANAFGPLLHMAGRHRRGNISERLSVHGAQVDVHTLYDQELLPLSEKAQSLLHGEAHVVVPLFSPRTAKRFIEQAQQLDGVIVVAISDAVATVCKGVRDLRIARKPNRQEMILSVEKALCDITLLEGRTDAG